ncbi:helix-turn-helix domain-containing protein [uncultured Methanoregula sp.]|uniref:transcriptional regulator n=1 Tax=uncultured Methanoregula sp. TaxID=1005933 RepID=UPI002AABFAE7|nr:helix-turn-helix domain-containing protein [uncultured Methanoregula sp.]
MTKHTCTLMHCDSMVRILLPPMRAEMVSRLVQKQGLSQSDAAKRLGVTRAAVSQYMSRKRGAGEVMISSEMDAIIDRWALAVVTGESDINLCDVCQCAKKKF